MNKHFYPHPFLKLGDRIEFLCLSGQYHYDIMLNGELMEKLDIQRLFNIHYTEGVVCDWVKYIMTFPILGSDFIIGKNFIVESLHDKIERGYDDDLLRHYPKLRLESFYVEPKKYGFKVLTSDTATLRMEENAMRQELRKEEARHREAVQKREKREERIKTIPNR